MGRGMGALQIWVLSVSSVPSQEDPDTHRAHPRRVVQGRASSSFPFAGCLNRGAEMGKEPGVCSPLLGVSGLSRI